jgi:aminoacyl-tRNA hydrolase
VKLIVGLGNPGRAYDGTRHNVGFDALAILANRAGSPLRRQRFQGEVAQVTLRGSSALLLWPLTWMNLSGSSVLSTRDFYKIDHANILVICDDFQLSLGTIRLRGSGSGGGQNGLADVLARLGLGSEQANSYRWKTVEQGSATTVWAALGCELEGHGGLYLEDVAEAVPSAEGQMDGVKPWAINPAMARQLWDWSEDAIARCGL